MSFHVRRKDREITDANEIQQILKETKYVTIAFCLNNEPYLVSLNHGYDEAKNCLYFHCAPEGKKLIYAKNNPKVWGQAVVDFGVTDECDYAYTSVHFQGKISLISDSAEKRHALEVLVRQVALNPESKLLKIKPEKVDKTTFVKIEITYLSGKKHQAPSQNQI
jgi:nitroimidazol reductase NimA-like FMN-containing flavoprotein (pyridoxamine 5'-phosphate oxidase superfamily)